MEILDVYDDNCQLTGKTVIRRQGKLSEHEHVRSSHIVIRNQDGLYLIQRRSLTKNSRPGVWDLTCGAVSSGEDAYTGAIREVGEEVGLKIKREDLVFLGRVLSVTSVFQDIFYVQTNFELSDCKMQKEEVMDLKLISKDEMIEFMKNLTHRTEEYRKIIIDYIKNI